MAGAVLFATAPAAEGGPAAAVPYDGTTPLRRLLDQLASLGVVRARVITRPAYAAALEPSLAGAGLEVELRVCADPSEDLAAVAEIAREGDGLVLSYADAVTHREALAGLIADPRLSTGVLARSHRSRHAYCFATRATRGRVVSAASAYHWVDRGNGFFLGVMRVDPGDEPVLAEAAERLVPLLRQPLRDDWLAELERKHRLDEYDRSVREPGHHEITRRFDRAVAAEDVPALLLMGMVRLGANVGIRYLRSLFWDRPLSRAAAARAAGDIQGYDEDRVLLDAAVKASDGFFTTFFVSTYSRYIARFAARRGLSPNQITVFSMFLGLLAAAGFGTGERWGLVAGALLLQAAFTFDCVDGQLARYTRTFSRFGAWLDSVFDRAKEYVVYAGLAIGSVRGFGVDAWPLAASALTLQTVRHMFDFSYGRSQHQAIEAVTRTPLESPSDGSAHPPREVPAALPTQPAQDEAEGAMSGPPPSPLSDARPLARRGLAGTLSVMALRFSRILDRAPGARWAKRIVVLPIGERFALISLTAALFTPRTTFVALLIWGGVAATYSLSSRVMRTVVS